ncbi:hypothetical protein [Brachybacterium squillarum]|uniref:hypothetical protein n=1 Tax=Brachybacterium squillarum TaxID=661979 RepID=UPI000262973D|nr:hypothetical protein [Brachybacterium squillarum]
MLHELARRWGSGALTAVIEGPDEETLVRLDVEELPTWLLLRAVEPGALNGHDDSGGPADVLELGDLPTQDVTGVRRMEAPEDTSDPAQAPLAGRWAVQQRRVGNLPKHEVDRMLRDPDASPSDAAPGTVPSS